jgi:hypothetical protein
MRSPQAKMFEGELDRYKKGEAKSGKAAEAIG